MSTALAFQISHQEYTQRLTGALRLAYVNERMPVKKIADTAGSSLATAKNWWEQRNPPEGLYLARLVNAVPELQAEYRRITAMETNNDPQLARAISELVQTWQRTKGSS